jgi:cephalosporin-C deacetylase-like acetyl esterase
MPSAPWNLAALSAVPSFTVDAERSTDDVTAVFYDGIAYRGKPTRVFAYYAIPKLRPGETCPAMVLVHGGGGSAFSAWVKLWLSRGYAAIAMDTCGCISGEGYLNHPRHEQGGPQGWGDFDNVDEPPGDQWTCHAVADVILAHSLIRSMPGVDPQRVGITGVSWGGYLTCITAAIDSRFRFAAPVYGCGFLGDNSAWLDQFTKMGDDKASRWLAMWDPSVHLSRAAMPMLWVTGTNDFAYPMDSLQKSYRLPASPRTLCIRVNMPHGHGPVSEAPEEIHAFANALFKHAAPLPRITATGRDGANAWLSYASDTPIRTAEFNYTTDVGPWQQREWKTLPASLDTTRHRATAALPAGTTVYYFNLIDTRDLIVSSEHEVLP